jgi:hypothetical protein
MEVSRLRPELHGPSLDMTGQLVEKFGVSVSILYHILSYAALK